MRYGDSIVVRPIDIGRTDIISIIRLANGVIAGRHIREYIEPIHICNHTGHRQANPIEQGNGYRGDTVRICGIHNAIAVHIHKHRPGNIRRCRIQEVIADGSRICRERNENRIGITRIDIACTEDSDQIELDQLIDPRKNICEDVSA